MRTRAAAAVRSAATILAMTAALAACSGADVSRSRTQTGRTYGTEVWYEAAFGDSPDEIVVRFDGADGRGDDECAPERDVLVEPEPTLVRVTVKRYSPSPVVRCEARPQTATAVLGEPLGDRVVVNPQTGWRFRVDGARLVLDPDSTPCGRPDCSEPAVAKATCNPFEYSTVIDEQIKRGKTPDVDVRCDGSFLALTRDNRRSWFVNRDAGWKLLTQDGTRCDDVWRLMRVRFPDALCR